MTVALFPVDGILVFGFVIGRLLGVAAVGRVGSDGEEEEKGYLETTALVLILALGVVGDTETDADGVDSECCEDETADEVLEVKGTPLPDVFASVIEEKAPAPGVGVEVGVDTNPGKALRPTIPILPPNWDLSGSGSEDDDKNPPAPDPAPSALSDDDDVEDPTGLTPIITGT